MVQLKTGLAAAEKLYWSSGSQLLKLVPVPFLIRSFLEFPELDVVRPSFLFLIPNPNLVLVFDGCDNFYSLILNVAAALPDALAYYASDLGAVLADLGLEGGDAFVHLGLAQLGAVARGATDGVSAADP
ncbi:hypothetical protein PG991_014860 [Apiospora marii]|uniref:Uncharacterized protein n=1 Tax=Apiospora marii TaxID=335849 RepID=A0ABR1R5L8_9PEZI